MHILTNNSKPQFLLLQDNQVKDTLSTIPPLSFVSSFDQSAKRSVPNDQVVVAHSPWRVVTSTSKKISIHPGLMKKTNKNKCIYSVCESVGLINRGFFTFNDPALFSEKCLLPHDFISLSVNPMMVLVIGALFALDSLRCIRDHTRW